jgi:hypothetical protein
LFRLGLRRLLTITVCSAALAGGAAAPASAFVAEPASSNVTSPADGTYLSVNDNVDPNATVTVTGTAKDSSNADYDGTVDLQCTGVFSGTTYVFSTAASNVTVTGGAFTTNVKIGDIAGGYGNTCILRAVPHDAGGGLPADLSPYTGPGLAVGFFDSTNQKVAGAGNPNAGTQYGFLLAGQGFSGQVEPLTSAGQFGGRNLGSFLPSSPAVYEPEQSIYYGSGYFSNQGSFSDGTKTDLVVDGKNAYTPSGTADPTNLLYSGSDAAAGVEALQTSNYSFDPTTGVTTLVETDPLVRCAPPVGGSDPNPRGAASNAPSATNCPAFADTGVKLVRTITYDHDGKQLLFQDAYQSTDAASHSVSLRYNHGLVPPNGGDALTNYRFDWVDASAHAYTGGDSVAAAPAGLHTIYIEPDGGAATGTSGTKYGRAAITFSGATDGAKFFADNEDSFELNFLNRAVPATGSLKINVAYSVAPSQSEVDSLVTDAAIRVAQPPAITAGGTLNYTEGQSAQTLDGSVTVSDPDSANLASASVTLTDHQTGDLLAANTSGAPGITTNHYDPTTGVLTLSGSDTVAHYESVLKAVTYSSSSSNPGSSRTVHWQVNDGALPSNTASSSIAITQVDNAPTATDDAAQVDQDASETTVDVLANDTDPDGGPKEVTAVTSPAHGTATVTNSGADVGYKPAPGYCNSQSGGTPDTFTYTVTGGSQATVSMTVTCAGAKPKPVVTVIKKLSPSADSGRFDLRVNGVIVKASAGDGGRGSTPVNSGSDVTVSESAANGHSLTDYDSSIDCGSAGKGNGTSLKLTNVVADTTCTITNARHASPKPPVGHLTIAHPDTGVNKRGTLVHLRCRGAAGARCKGTLKLESTDRSSRLSAASSKKGKKKVKFNIAAGSSKDVRIQLPAKTRAQLAAHGKAVARAVAHLTDGTTVKRLITVYSH